MASEEPLGILLDEIEALASIVHERCTHVSSEFAVTKLAIISLLAILKQVRDDLSKPESEIQHAKQAESEALVTMIGGYRRLLQQLDNLAAKDHSLKKKRIWKRDKDNTAAVGQLHGQLNSLTVTISIYLSTRRGSQPSFPDFAEEVKNGGQDAFVPSQAVNQESEADAQWSVLRRKLVEDGITDVDIEAHTSSIRALLQDKLPSYYEIYTGPNVEETTEVTKASTSSHEVAMRKTSQLEHGAFTPGDHNDEADFGRCARPGVSSSFSRRLSPLNGHGANYGLALPKEDKNRVSHTYSADAGSGANYSQGIFYIADSTDSESEILHRSKERFLSESPSLPPANMTTKTPHSLLSPIDHECSVCHKVFRGSRLFRRHKMHCSEPNVWSCSAIRGHDAAFTEHNDSSLSVCGYCGEFFPKSSDADWTRRRKHLSKIHKWEMCLREKQFYRADHFRQHLKHAHNGVSGWWIATLEGSARRMAQEPSVTDAFTRPLSGRRSGSPLHRRSSVSYHDDSDLGHGEIVRRPSSTMSRTSSMARIHSDVSEYDVQGNLTKRTVTTSYTSISDAAAPPLERYHSSPGPQSQAPSAVTPSAPATNTQSANRASFSTRSPREHGFYCSFCSESRKYYTHATLAHHMCRTHTEYFAHPFQALEHEELKRGYKGLPSALQSPRQDGIKPSNSDEEAAGVTTRITQKLEDVDLDVDFQLSSSEGSENIDPADALLAEDEEVWKTAPMKIGGPRMK